MNREQRRKAEKNVKSKLKVSATTAKEIVKLQGVRQELDPIPEGTKVKININNTEKGNPVRNKWIDENQDRVFTVKYNPKWGENPIMVEFEEDNLWLWCINELDIVTK